MLTARLSIAVGALIISTAATASAQQKPADGEWSSYGGDKGFTRYSPLAQINRDNVKNLQVVARRLTRSSWTSSPT